MTRQEFINDFVDRAPGPIISRAEAARLSGGIIRSGTLANQDSLGVGCPDRVRIGRRVGYITRSYACWLAAKIDGLKD